MACEEELRQECMERWWIEVWYLEGRVYWFRYCWRRGEGGETTVDVRVERQW